MPVSPRIKGLSDVRRLPRLGKIRLGIKVKSAKTGNEYPKEVSYFVCPPEVQRVYGEKPTTLDIMFPLEDETKCAPQNFKAYVFNGLRCKGDGDVALRRVSDLKWMKDGKLIDDATTRLVNGPPPDDPNAMVEIQCPCALLESGDCRQSLNLMVLLPKVSMGGVYQVDSGSYHNIVRVNSGIDYVRALLGRVALVPLLLHRQQEEIQYEGKKAKHYLLQITLNANLEEVAMLREKTRMVLTETARLALPKPVDDGVDPAPGGVVIDAESEEAEAEAPILPQPLAEASAPKQQEASASPQRRQAVVKILESHGLDLAMLPNDITDPEAMLLIGAQKKKAQIQKFLETMLDIRHGVLFPEGT